MTLVKIEDVIDHLSSDMKSALQVAVKTILPDAAKQLIPSCAQAGT